MSQHGVQFRPTGSQGPLYAPGRDFVHCYPAMLVSIAKAFDSQYWPELLPMIAKLNDSTEETAWDALCDAQQVYATFLAECCRSPQEGVSDVLRRVGWEELPQAIRFGWATMLGVVTIGQLFAGLRDISLEGDVPPPSIKGLLEHHLRDARRIFNEIVPAEEAASELRAVIKQARLAGLSFEEIAQCVSDVKLAQG